MDVQSPCWALDLQPFTDEIEGEDTRLSNNGAEGARNCVGGAVREMNGRSGVV